MKESKFQIGKNGLTEGVVSSINSVLKTHNRIRISVFKSATRDKTELIKMAEEIKNNVGYLCSYKIIGFTIILMRRSPKPKTIN